MPVESQQQVSVFERSLAAADSEITASWRLLSASERDRADRFYRPRDAAWYIVGRGWLRRVIAEQLDKDPAAIRFEENRFGKPSLADAGDIHFNLSHSHGHAVVAIARGFEVGIDIELVRTSPIEVATLFFSEEERAALARLGPDAVDEAFFACWTRKEAVVKALGEGLSFPLHAFSVTVCPGRRPAIERFDGESSEADRWQLETIRPAPHFIGAVAARRRGWCLVEQIGPQGARRPAAKMHDLG